MKELKIKAEGLGAGEILTKEELKHTLVQHPHSSSRMLESGGCSASISCPDGIESATCTCQAEGTCSTFESGVSCSCGVDGVTFTCAATGPGSGSGSGSGSDGLPGSGSYPGSGSSGGGTGSSGSSGGPYWLVFTQNVTSLTVPVKIDGNTYNVLPGNNVLPLALFGLTHTFEFLCIYSGTELAYIIDDGVNDPQGQSCGMMFYKPITSNITLMIELY